MRCAKSRARCRKRWAPLRRGCRCRPASRCRFELLKTPSSLEELIAALRCLPGVGPKSAQRMAYHLLQRDKPGAHRLACALSLALERIRHCEKCNSYAEEPVCELCRSPRRNQTL